MSERQNQELIVVFTGPNGAGRKTVADMVGTTLRLKEVLSYTTRAKRPNEVDGEDYHFVPRATFETAEANGEFIEVLDIDGNRYGIKRADVEEQLVAYGGVYVILNRYGAEQLKNHYGDKVKRVFIYADRDTLITRQRERGDSDALIMRYMLHFEEEMAYRSQCEFAYENIDLAHTVYDVTKALEPSLARGLLELD